MQTIIHLIDAAIDRFERENHRQPTLIRLGLNQVAGLRGFVYEYRTSGAPGPPNYRDIPVEELRDVSRLEVW
jgi:hypothetical protein